MMDEKTIEKLYVIYASMPKVELPGKGNGWIDLVRLAPEVKKIGINFKILGYEKFGTFLEATGIFETCLWADPSIKGAIPKKYARGKDSKGSIGLITINQEKVNKIDNDSQYSEPYQTTPMEQISAPKSTQQALDKLLYKMYVSNVSKRLRELNQPSDIDKKRWIWELLQNAKDTIANNPQRRTVRARIIIEGDKVKFQHDGDPFSADTRLGLLYKYSEDKDSAESTGRFGTGFLTTHCLSKIVSIESNMIGDKDGDKDVVVGFSVTMYRDGTTEGELLDGIERMKESETYYKQQYEWTTFTYHINSESGRQAVKLGKENLGL